MKSSNNINYLNFTIEDAKDLVEELPAIIREQVVRQAYRDILSIIKFFENKEADFLWLFIPILKQMKVYSKDILYN